MRLEKVNKSFVRTAVTALAIIGLVGCEDDGSGRPPPDFGDNDPNRVACVGDSITQGGYPGALAAQTGKSVADLGVGGFSSSEGLGLIGGALARKPGYMCILFGANDIIDGSSLQAAENNLRTMIRLAVANHTVPVIATLTPMLGLEVNHTAQVETLSERIRVLAPEEGARLADVFKAFASDPSLLRPDGLHPNAAGQALIASTFAAQIDD